MIRSSRTGSYYVGSTEDLWNRLGEHNSGENKSTRSGIPWVLVQVEEFPTRSEARNKENRIRSRGISRYLKQISKTA
ncbi:MAG: GIY-YIG nuclease family protein [Bacteroidota bacterium]